MQGLGSTLFEALIFEDGQLLNPNLIDYRIPMFSDLPASFGTVLLQHANGPGPYGAIWRALRQAPRQDTDSSVTSSHQDRKG
jgi:hypothetical protein